MSKRQSRCGGLFHDALNNSSLAVGTWASSQRKTPATS